MPVFTIPAHQPFLETLASGIRARIGDDPLALAQITILLPSRRACRSLREAFLRQESAGGAMLLPRLSAIGDLDADDVDLGAGDALPEGLDLPLALSPIRRQLLLTQLILQWGKTTGTGPNLPAQAAALARDLAALIEQIRIERIGFENLGKIVPEELAAHWQVTTEFLKIMTETWPTLLATHDAIDAADRQNRLIDAMIALWRRRPPANPVIAAGFTTANPATTSLLSLLAMLPQGSVILPGVMTTADDRLWTEIDGDPTHPQYGIARLLAALGVHHDALTDWSAGPSSSSQTTGRAGLAETIMLPASVTENWRKVAESSLLASLQGLRRVDCPGPQEEAGIIALLLRETLETPGATAMLVTPDRSLARRVAAELRRWDIEIDDSAGIPLNLTPPGVFMRLLNTAAAEALAPIPLLALLKHPLAGLGMETGALRRLVRELERKFLRGPRPLSGLDGLQAAAIEFRQSMPELSRMLERLIARLAPFIDLLVLDSASLTEIISAHISVCEMLAATSDLPGGATLWKGEAGEALARHLAELLEAAENLPALNGTDYPPLFETLLAGGVVRPRFGRHPRLQILGTLEARLQQADLVILGGLNEGVWPAATGDDPWMSRPMRHMFGLPPLEAQIGLAAHDFASALMAPQVVLTRPLKADGAPTVPSRWLLRLDTVLKATGLALPSDTGLLAWQAQLDRPGIVKPAAEPMPCPPVTARPDRLSVTDVELWFRDPYAIYAKHILKLRALDPLDQDPGAADNGSFIHAALDRFIRLDISPEAPNALEELLRVGRESFGNALAHPGVWAFWWPRFERIARWFLKTEVDRPKMARSWTELRGHLPLLIDAHGFTLDAKADRIDLLADGTLEIIDYKTGGIPKEQDILRGFSPQLPLEALIAESGSFEGIAATAVSRLAYWRLSGGNPAGEIKALGKDSSPTALAAAARLGLEAMIRKYARIETPYQARPEQGMEPRYSDYIHLSRLGEWGGGADE